MSEQTELQRYLAWAEALPEGYTHACMPESTPDDPVVNVTGPDGTIYAVISMPPGPDGNDLVLCPLDEL